jgi:Prolipoprotein diacylglyceryl transferase
MLLRMAWLTAAIPSPSTNVVHLGPFVVHVYGLCYVLAVLAAVAITRRRWAARGGSRDLVYDVALWAVPAGILGGRLYFLATTPGDTFEHWWGPLAVWEGGLGIWGGIAAGTIVGLWRVRLASASLADFLDAAAPALLVAQAIGRIGNYFNQELFGGPPTCPGRSRSTATTDPSATSPIRPSTRRSFTNCSGTSRSLPRSCGSTATAASAHPACSPSTSPATAPSASSTSCYASTRPRTSSGCSQSPAQQSAWPGSRPRSAEDNSARPRQLRLTHRGDLGIPRLPHPPRGVRGGLRFRAWSEKRPASLITPSQSFASPM